MLKRPINPQFNQAVLHCRKITTIRKLPWPVGKPIMFYNWSGAAYRSPQVNVAAVVVEETMPIGIERIGDKVCFFPARALGAPLWQVEGFESEEAMQAWFLAKMKAGQCIENALMRFVLKIPHLCDCQDPDHGYISNECHVHNHNPVQSL